MRLIAINRLTALVVQ